MRARGLRRRLLAASALVLGAAALVLVPAASASAHDYLVGSTPAAGSTITAPVSSVSLTFDAGILDFGRGSDGVVVTGPGASTRHFETRCARVSGDTISAPVALGAAGRYTISWRVVSADGHPVSDDIAFTYRPAAGTAAVAGSVTGPDCGVSINRAAHFGAPGDSGGDGGVVALVIGVAVGVTLLIVAALVVVVVVLRRAGPVDPADDAPEDDAPPGADPPAA